MNAVERMAAAFRFQPVDRTPVIEWATWWRDTVERWRGEGLPADVTDLHGYFGLDPHIQIWISPYLPDVLPPPSGHGAARVRGMDEYLALRGRMYNLEETFDEPRWARCLDGQRAGNVPFWFTVAGFFWFPRVLFGIEGHLYAFYDEPELMHRINADQADWIVALVRRLRALDRGAPLFMTFAEDMSYNHGPMLSEALFDEFLLPYYQKVIPEIKALGTIPIIDSDGDVSAAIPWFERAGLSGLLPLERQAGVDVARLRDRHPRFILIGAFDKMTMPKGEGTMRAEFERLLPTMRRGGFVASVDHQTPPGVSLDQYRIYARLAHEYARRAGGE